MYFYNLMKLMLSSGFSIPSHKWAVRICYALVYFLLAPKVIEDSHQEFCLEIFFVGVRSPGLGHSADIKT